jgi:hypothetical protein
MTDEAIAEELRRQRDLLEKYPPDSAVWIAASRIVHHLSAEKRRRETAAKSAAP